MPAQHSGSPLQKGRKSGFENSVHGLVATQQSPIQQADVQFDIVFTNFSAFGEGTDGVAER